ncbi:MAG: hypothetical protein IH855_13945 [Bacteroidetes bacterium]|nr:hypothetical protein [Bacteroidota bacterium]
MRLSRGASRCCDDESDGAHPLLDGNNGIAILFPTVWKNDWAAIPMLHTTEADIEDVAVFIEVGPTSFSMSS